MIDETNNSLTCETTVNSGFFDESGVGCETYTDRGIVGETGKSAYEQAVEGGYEGTEEEFEEALASGITTVADNVSDVNTVANNIQNVNTTANNTSNINEVVNNMESIVAAPTAATNAAASASAALASQTAAGNASTAASGYATTASQKASEAGSSASSASISATNASTSATNAQTWAEGSDLQVQALGGTKSSKGWANRAQELVESIGTVMKYKGSVANYAALQAIQNPTIGDTYNVLDTGSNYTWDGSAWDAIGSVVDLSAYRTAADQDVIDSGKQATLVSGTNIKTVNGNSLLGDGNVDIDALPSQTGQSGKFLTTNGTAASWANVDALPSQTGQSGKYLTTDGTTSSWATVEASSVAVGNWFDNVSGTTLGTGITGANIRVYKNGKLLQPGQSITARLYTGGYGKSISLAQTAPLSTANSWLFETELLWDNTTSGSTPCVLCYTGTTDWQAPVIIYEVNMGWYLGSTGSSWNLDSADRSSLGRPDTGSFYKFRAEFTGTSYILSYKKNGDDWQIAREFGNSTKVYCSVPFLLLNSEANPSRCYNGSTLNMAKTKLVIDGQTWFDGATAVAGTDYTNNGCTVTETTGSTNDYHYDPTTGVITFSERLYGDDIAIEYSETIGEGILGRNIGEVFFSESSSAADNVGALPLFTGETISNADELYPDFYQWVADHTGLQISAADYETALSTYGECPKYVIDTTNKTIRLPKLVNYLKMANTTDGIAQAGAGLPNIYTEIATRKYESGVGTVASVTGAGTFANDGYPAASNVYTKTNGSSSYALQKSTIDASVGNSIYGNSNTVTPTHTTLFPWVCAYNAAVPASTAQAAQFQAALSSKADTNLGNCTKPYVTETYVNGTSWYRIWSDGWCEQGNSKVPSSTSWKTILLLQQYKDTNYQVIATNNGNINGTSSWTTVVDCQVYTRDSIQLKGAGADANWLISWKTCGYIR